MQREQLAQEFPTLLDFFNHHVERGTLHAKNNVNLRYTAYHVEDSQGALVVLGGRTDSYVKYAELWHDFKDTKYSLYILDQRGHGFSDPLSQSQTKSFRFNDYVDDLKQFLNDVVAKHGHQRIVLLGYSMGGVVAALYALRYPNTIHSMIVCSPMFGINTGIVPSWCIASIATMLDLVGKGARAFPFGKKYDIDRLFQNAGKNGTRGDIIKQLFEMYPETRIGIPTVRWMREAMRAGRYAVRHAGHIATPTLLLQAGRDKTVKLQAQDRFSARAPLCTHVCLSDARHDIIMEKDALRDKALHFIRDFLN